MNKFIMNFRLVTCVLAAFTVHTLNALEIPKHTEDAYVQEVDTYEAMLKEQGYYEKDHHLVNNYPFTDSKNPRLLDFNDQIFQSLSSIPHPCPEKMSAKKNLPEIQLDAESHYCPNCSLDFKKTMIEGRDGKFILASEGVDFESPQKIETIDRGYFPDIVSQLPISNVYSYGIENSAEDKISDYISLINSLNAIKKISSEKEWKAHFALDAAALDKGPNDEIAYYTNLILSNVQSILTDNATKDSLNKLYSKNPKLKELISPLEKTIQTSIREKDIDKSLSIQTKATNETLSLESLYELATGVTREMISEYVDKRPELPHAVTQFLSPNNLDFGRDDDVEICDELFTSTFRNINFARNIAALYCQQSLKSGKALRVVIGGYHAVAQKYLIEKIFPTSGPTPEIKIRNLFEKYMGMSTDTRKELIRKDMEELRKAKN